MQATRLDTIADPSSWAELGESPCRPPGDVTLVIIGLPAGDAPDVLADVIVDVPFSADVLSACDVIYDV